MKGNGFDRLRSAAIMGVMGAGSLAGGTARAAAASLPLNHTVVMGSRSGKWGTGAAQSTGGKTTSGIGNLNWCLNPAVTGTYQSSTGFCIGDGALQVGTASKGDWIDSAFAVAVDGVLYANPDGTVDVTGDTLTTDSATVSGVDVRMKMQFGVGRAGVLRVLYSFTNPTGSMVSKTIAIGGNLGSDSSTTAQWSQNGDATIDATDGWYISSDNTTVGGDTSSDPLFTFARFGASAAVTPTATSVAGTIDGTGNKDDFAESFALDIPAHATRSIVIFAEMSQTLTEAKASAASYSSVNAMKAAGLLAGLSATERNQVVNYHMPMAAADDGGAMEPASLLTLSGLLALAGLRRRKTPQR